MELKVSEPGSTSEIYSFRQLSKLASERRVHNVIKRFSVSLYDDDCKCFSIDLARYEILKYQQNMDIPSSPPTGVALTHLSPVSHFYTPGKPQKTKGFSGVIEM